LQVHVLTSARTPIGRFFVKIGYQLKAKTPTQQGSQPDRGSADPEAHFIPPYVGSLKISSRINDV